MYSFFDGSPDREYVPEYVEIEPIDFDDDYPDFWDDISDYAQREEDDAKGIRDDPWSDNEFLAELENATF